MCISTGIKKLVSLVVLSVFSFVIVCSELPKAHAVGTSLPMPNQLLLGSQEFSYPVLKGLKINPDNPLEMEFIIDSANKKTVTKDEASKLIQYFLAAVTVPQEDLWVNLSPYEADRVVTDSLGQTELGTELLSQDYLLKQFSSSLTDPNTELGKHYWNKAELTSAFNKIWIVPGESEVYESGDQVFVTKATLDVQSDVDMMAMQANNVGEGLASSQNQGQTQGLSLLLDPVRKEINQGENFAPIRQAHHSIILGLWFKQKLKDSIFKQYIDKNKVVGIDKANLADKEKLFNAYVQSFKHGVYNRTLKERTGRRLEKRAYFSGGYSAGSAIVQKAEETFLSNTGWVTGKTFVASIVLGGPALLKKTNTQRSELLQSHKIASSTVSGRKISLVGLVLAAVIVGTAFFFDFSALAGEVKDFVVPIYDRGSDLVRDIWSLVSFVGGGVLTVAFYAVIAVLVIGVAFFGFTYFYNIGVAVKELVKAIGMTRKKGNLIKQEKYHEAFRAQLPGITPKKLETVVRVFNEYKEGESFRRLVSYSESIVAKTKQTYDSAKSGALDLDPDDLRKQISKFQKIDNLQKSHSISKLVSKLSEAKDNDEIIQILEAICIKKPKLRSVMKIFYRIRGLKVVPEISNAITLLSAGEGFEFKVFDVKDSQSKPKEPDTLDYTSVGQDKDGQYPDFDQAGYDVAMESYKIKLIKWKQKVVPIEPRALSKFPAELTELSKLLQKNKLSSSSLDVQSQKEQSVYGGVKYTDMQVTSSRLSKKIKFNVAEVDQGIFEKGLGFVITSMREIAPEAVFASLIS